MRQSEIKTMGEAEQNYWWHVSRRFILQSILKKYLFPELAPTGPLRGRRVTFRHVGQPHPSADAKALADKPSSHQGEERRGHSGYTSLPSFWGASGATPLAVSCGLIRGQAESYNNVTPRLRSGNKWGCSGNKLRDVCKILDVGCGTGANLIWLKNFGNVVGIDSNEEAIEFCKKHGKAILSSATKLPVEGKSQDLITAFDVLEHLKDDKKALHEWHRVLKDNGYLFISVPAYQWLFSNRDKQLGHYRRYNLYNLLKLLRQTGFEVVFNSHIFTLVFPLFILQRIFFQKKTTSVYPRIPKPLNNFLGLVSNFEIQLLKFMRFPFGGSIVILAQKL